MPINQGMDKLCYNHTIKYYITVKTMNYCYTWHEWLSRTLLSRRNQAKRVQIVYPTYLKIQIKVKTNLWWQENRTMMSLGNGKGRGIGRQKGANCEGAWEKGPSEILIMFYILIWVAVSWVFTFLKIHYTVHLSIWPYVSYQFKFKKWNKKLRIKLTRCI